MMGPAGTKNMATHLEEAFMPDIRIRMADEKLPREGVRFEARDITPGIVYEANGVTVTEFDVDHGDEIKPAYGYRIDYRGHSRHALQPERHQICDRRRPVDSRSFHGKA